MYKFKCYRYTITPNSKQRYMFTEMDIEQTISMCYIFQIGLTADTTIAMD